MKILILADVFSNGGMETNILSYVKNCKNDYGYYMCVNKISNNFLNSSDFEEIQCAKFSGDEFNDNIDKIKRLCIENNVSIIHAHTANTYLFAAILSYELKIPYIITIHGPNTIKSIDSILKQDIITNIAIKNSNLVYVVSEEMKKLASIYSNKIQLLNNYIDLESYTYEDRYKYREINRWAFIGRIDDDKLEGIISAIKSLHIYEVQAIDIFGDGNAFDKLKAFIKSYSTSIDINLKGFKKNINKEIQSGYTGILGMGRALLEGLSMGYPGILVGYDGIKGFITTENFECVSMCNFSGRNMQSLSEEDMYIDKNKFNENILGYDLLENIKKKYDLKIGLKIYITTLQSIKYEEKYELENISKVLELANKDENIYSSSTIFKIYHDKFYPNNSSLLMCELLNQNNRAYDSIIKNNQEKEILKYDLNELENKTSILKHKQEEDKAKLIKYNKDLNYYININENLKNELNRIYSSKFWKIASKYYYLRYNNLSGSIANKMKKFIMHKPNEINLINNSYNNKVENLTKNIKNKSVFIFAGVAYYDIGGGQRSAQLAKTFYKMGYNVNYIYAYDSSEKKGNNLDIPLKSHIHIDEINSAFIKENLSKDDMFIFEIPHEKFCAYLEQAKIFGIKTIYEHIDNWETSLGGEWFNITTYKYFLEQSDLLIATAILLKEKISETLKIELNNTEKEVLYLPNAVDCEMFESIIEYKKPHDLVLGDKTLIYYGSLWGEWFNWELIFDVANKFSNYDINLIGEYKSVKNKLKNIPKNVHFLGLKKQAELPAYLKYCDYAILPFNNCKIGKYVSPLKIFEYISMVKVVISTRLDDIKDYPNVYYGDTSEEWTEILKNEPKPTESISSFVNDNNWYNRCDVIINKLSFDKIYKNTVSIIVLNRNNKKTIFRCIDSLILNNAYDYEIIVVDNESTDGSYEMLREKYETKIKLIKNNKNGCSSGRNLGVKNSNGDMLVFLDSDQWVWGRHWLNNAIDILENDKSIGAVGWAAGWFTEESVGGPIVDYLENRGIEGHNLYRKDVAYLGTGGMVVDRKIYDLIDGFDEYYDPTCYEDTDFSLSIKTLGFDLAYCPFLTIFHLPHQTTNSGSDFHKQLMKRNGEYFEKKWLKKNSELLKVYLK